MKSCAGFSKDFSGICRGVLALVFLWLAPGAWACWGPFFSNDELDKLSFLEPSALGDHWLDPFYLYASPPLGQSEEFRQAVITPRHVPVSASDALDNQFEYAPGNDLVLTAANEAEWLDYFTKVRGLTLDAPSVADLLYEKKFPPGLSADDKEYFQVLLNTDAESPDLTALGKKRALNPKLPGFLRARWAFLAVRSAALSGAEETTALFAQVQPALSQDKLSEYRARCWKAYSLFQEDHGAALPEYLAVFDQCPELRTVALSSLAQFAPEDFSAYLTKEKSPHRRGLALFVSFLLADRDFSPETLEQIFQEIPGETKPLFVLFRMVEEVEREAGISKLLNLTSDPAQARVTLDEDKQTVQALAKKGLYTALVKKAAELGRDKKALYPRLWLTLAAYLSFYDGDRVQMAALYTESLKYPAANPSQEKQSQIVGLMVQMGGQVGKTWDQGVQNKTVDLLEWARTLDQPGHNRGLYHSLLVVAAQKYLETDRRELAAAALLTLHSGQWGNIYQVIPADWFWSGAGMSNNAGNLLLDVLVRDEDITRWKNALGTTTGKSLDDYFMAASLLKAQDLDYLQAYHFLRRNEPEKAKPLLAALDRDRYFSGTKTWRDDGSVFPVRTFEVSRSLDPLDLYSGRDMKEVSLGELADLMAQVKAKAQTSSQGQLEAGIFWTSLQVNGFPLIFQNPPRIIHFVGNLEFYGYDGSDNLDGDGKAAREFPFFLPDRADDYRQQLRSFQAEELSAVNRAKGYFEAVLNRHTSPKDESQALLFLKRIEPDRDVLKELASPRYKKTPIYLNLVSYCEDFRSYL